MNMAATAAGNGTVPNQLGPNGGNLHSYPNSTTSNCGQQDLGAPMSSQDTGPPPHPQQHLSTRPVFYVSAPPPPPFLPFQWPMSFSYNPFGGFPGYGMVIPPFAPPPYVDSPAYILPHPHIQPVDYRRFLHPQVPAPSASYQNPNPMRRIRLPQAAPVRETVNSAVQTEPAQRNVGRYPNGSPPVRSDSGHGTTSDSPSSSSSSSQKQPLDSCRLTSNRAKDVQPHKTGIKDPDKHGENVLAPHPVPLDIPSCIRRTVEKQMCRKASVDQETVPPYKNTRCNIWSVGSPDGMVPVCSSSQQEDEVVKERRVSFPDILMSWGGGTPKETNIPDKVFDQSENQLLSLKTVEEQEKPVCKSSSATSCSVALGSSDAGDAENVLCSQKRVTEPRVNEPLEFGNSGRRTFPSKDQLHSLNMSAELEKDETILSEEPTEMMSHQMLLGSSRSKGKMNESVWSVESLTPFVPSKDLMFQKNNVDSEVIVEMTEETENDKEATKCDDVGDKSSKKRLDFSRISPSDCVPVSTSWLDFTTQAQRALSLSKKPQRGTEPAEPQPGRVLSPTDKSPAVSITPPRSDVSPTAEEVEQNGSSEPEANQSPNQEVTVENTEQEQNKRASPESAVGEVVLQNGADPENVTSGSDECDLTSEQTTTDGVSPSKGHMVDCGIQCTSLLSYPQDKPLRFSFKRPEMSVCVKLLLWLIEMKKDNGGKAEGFHISGQMPKSFKRNGLRKYRGNGKSHR